MGSGVGIAHAPRALLYADLLGCDLHVERLVRVRVRVGVGVGVRFRVRVRVSDRETRVRVKARGEREGSGLGLLNSYPNPIPQPGAQREGVEGIPREQLGAKPGRGRLVGGQRDSLP